MIRKMVCAALKGLGTIIKSALTAPDGESWAPGRIMGFVTFIVGQCLIVRVSAALLPVLRDPDKWLIYFGAVAALQASTGATAIALVLGIAPTDSGGRWWSRNASPPPPPTDGKPPAE